MVLVEWRRLWNVGFVGHVELNIRQIKNLRMSVLFAWTSVST